MAKRTVITWSGTSSADCLVEGFVKCDSSAVLIKQLSQSFLSIIMMMMIAKTVLLMSGRASSVGVARERDIETTENIDENRRMELSSLLY